MQLSPTMKSPTKPKRSYLEKGPDKETKDRRNFLKAKLFEDEGSFELGDSDNELPVLASSQRRQRMSHSLSPKALGRKQRVRGRSMNKEEASSVPQLRRASSSSSETAEEMSLHQFYNLENSDDKPKKTTAEKIARSLSPGRLSKLVGVGARSTNNKDRRRSSANDASISPKTPTRKATHRRGHSEAVRSVSCDSLVSPKVFTRKLSLSSMAGLRRGHSEDPTLKESSSARQERTIDSLSGRRERTIDCSSGRRERTIDCAIAKQERNVDDSGSNTDALMDRVARRVAERRGKTLRSKTDGFELDAMRQALQRRQELELQALQKDEEADEGLGGLWSRGLRALEKVYDEVNTNPNY